ncbi:hypothetical protein CEUSTIGMA_g10932.t1 [Chlamydomonas eustigma]|uniref:J domain-containing protein n=1 Tax=Chlamydomonas eustigma TaxID=1157962 RepID=A0A250XKB5_9CHLO|nr:hypothetical protein CEUSTIGMA_g10932.t1 [Chlamydomonas eustigma]|eukprot:GAX83507.1 hypothetical protein CEUSTIGMA_g10932.t1 [Chlamydomonas eustigma]
MHYSSWLYDYYSTLGVAASANSEEIKKAFRKLALTFHPDRHATGTDRNRAEAAIKFKEITEAYEILSDDRKRAAYSATSRSRAASSSSYSSTSYQTVNPDYARTYYRHGQTSRISLWQHLQRTMSTASMKRFELMVGGGVALFMTAGVLCVEPLWEYRNKGRSFEDINRTSGDPSDVDSNGAQLGSNRLHQYTPVGCTTRSGKSSLTAKEEERLAHMSLKDLIALESATTATPED